MLTTKTQNRKIKKNEGYSQTFQPTKQHKPAKNSTCENIGLFNPIKTGLFLSSP